MKSTHFDYVMKNNLCSGCAACTQIDTRGKITVGIDQAGYLRPMVSAPLNQEEDGAFAEICPGLSVKHAEPQTGAAAVWGPIVSSYVGWSADDDVRSKGSSGGGITALVSYLLDSKVVDAVLHVGVSDASPLHNVYEISTTPSEARQNTGSRYAPAAPLEGLLKALELHERIAIVGKPCDIVAARKLAARSSRIRDGIKYYISFMCAGVPSMLGTHKLLDAMGAPRGRVVAFRYRGNGWPGLATAVLDNGEERTMTYDDSWGKILNKHLQFRCKICVDGTGEFADITFADAWHGDSKGYPSFEEQAGRSLVLTRTSAGSEVLAAAVAAKWIEIQPLAVEELEKMQPYQSSRKRLIFSRLLALRLLGIKTPRYDERQLLRLAVQSGIKANAISFIGMLRRAWNARLARSRG